MILTVGIDNTHILIGCFDGEDIRFSGRIATERNKTGMEYAISLRNVLELYEVRPSEIDGSIMACVVPALQKVLKEALELLLHKTPLVVGPGIKTGLSIVSDNSSTLGCDLVAMVAGAVAEYPVPLIVVELETATVLMAVDERKRFVGSVIAPGPQIAGEVLAEKCDGLPQISLEAPKEIIGRNTADCMRSGIVYGTAAMLDGMTDRIEEKLGGGCTVVATGSLAEIIMPHCHRKMRVDEHLFLKGLRQIYLKNVRK